MIQKTSLANNLIVFFKRRNSILDVNYDTYFIRGLKYYLLSAGLQSDSLILTTKFLSEFLEKTAEQIRELVKVGLAAPTLEERVEVLNTVTDLQRIYNEKVEQLEELERNARNL